MKKLLVFIITSVFMMAFVYGLGCFGQAHFDIRLWEESSRHICLFGFVIALIIGLIVAHESKD